MVFQTRACPDLVFLSTFGVVVDGLFFDRFRVAFVPCDDIDLINFDHTFELHFRFSLNDAFSKLNSHGLNVIFVQTKFERDLLVLAAAAEVDGPTAALLAGAGADPRRPAMTFSMAPGSRLLCTSGHCCGQETGSMARRWCGRTTAPP